MCRLRLCFPTVNYLRRTSSRAPLLRSTPRERNGWQNHSIRSKSTISWLSGDYHVMYGWFIANCSKTAVLTGLRYGARAFMTAGDQRGAKSPIVEDSSAKLKPSSCNNHFRNSARSNSRIIENAALTASPAFTVRSRTDRGYCKG